MLEFGLAFFIVFDITIKYVLFGKVVVALAGDSKELLVQIGCGTPHPSAGHGILDGSQVDPYEEAVTWTSSMNK